MPLRVSVLVPPAAAGSRSLLASLDRQTLPAAEFEVLIGDDERDPDLTARLDDLVAHRTNVARVPVPVGGDVAATLLDRASGEYVVAVPADRVFTPDALALLCDRADATGADVCLGLTGRAGSRPAGLPSDPDRLAGPAGGLRRRRATTAAQVADDLAGADATADGAAAVASTLCFVDGTPPDRPAPPEADRSVRARVVRATWTDGVLEVVAKLTEPSDDVRASVYSDRTGVEWPLTDVQVDGERVTLRIDPSSVPGVGTLPDGTWWPSLRIGGRSPVLLGGRPQKVHGASVRERTVISFSGARKRVGLDVGGHAHQPIRRLDPSVTSVVEDSRGSLLTSRLKKIDLAPGSRPTGELRLGRMPVVAWLEHDGTGPVLRAWVSGLAGESSLYTRFGHAHFAPTGTRLVVDGVGAMTVTRTVRRPAPEAETPEPSAAAPEHQPGRARRLAGRVRRSVRG
ncbi:glycosyltransferase [Nocardioides hankookensis]|uniref:Glycosyltransferase n=1 Tax=Nocardioides hankookensis TaxID=443157 RepID=A0ABW1LF95_9ACTN